MSRARQRRAAAETVPAFAGNGLLHAVIEATRGTRLKFKHDSATGLYKLSHVLPAGHRFPLDFGFVPGTEAQDGDPLDILVMLDEPTPVGCLLTVRLVGIIQAEQTQEGKTHRNDRLLAVEEQSREYAKIRTLGELPGRVVEEVETFFVSYNQLRGRTFRIIGRKGPEAAERTVRESMRKRRR